MVDGSKKSLLKIITKKPKTPCPEELRLNPSSRSAKLRSAERI
jgi:16S rRNA C1402 N4-methylase RsmH